MVWSSATTRVPGPSSKLERQWIRTPWLRAYSTERSWSTPAPGGRHLEHLLERDVRQLAGVRDDPRVGAEDAGDVGVDLADVGAERGGERDRGGVGAAAAERGHVAVSVERPGSRRRARSCPRRAPRDAVGADVDDARLGVRGVGDDAGLGAGQRDRLVAEVLDHHRASAQEIRSPVESSMSISRGSGRAETSWAIGDQFVGRLPARGQHGDHAVARLRARRSARRRA